MNEHIIQLLIVSAVMSGTPLVYAALGELIGEKAGVLNVGIEGVMLVGAATGYVFLTKTSNADIGLLAGAGAGFVFVLLLFSLPVVVLRTNQVLTGFALWLVGVGLSQIIGNNYVNVAESSTVPDVHIPYFSHAPFVGVILFQYPWPVYAAVLLTGFVAVGLSRTRIGLTIRAIGEDPSAADAAGIAVRWRRLACSAMVGVLGGFGGAFICLVYVGRWSPGMTAGAGWIALAVVILSSWHPLRLIVFAYLFGGLSALVSVGGALGWSVNPEFLGMVPYLGTVGALIIWFGARKGRLRGGGAPAALGDAGF